MTSLARGLTVIGAFTRQKRQLTIAQISQRTGIPRAAVRRCLHTLAELGYVGSDDRRTFALRPKILELGHAYMTSSPLASSSQPILDRVSEVIHESCSMAILDGDEILYIARSSTQDRIMSIDLGLGSRLPAHCTSMGRVLLAGLPPAELAAYLARVRIIAYTNRTITSPHKLGEVVARVRANGYALVDQELEIGLRSLAVPVRGPPWPRRRGGERRRAGVAGDCRGSRSAHPARAPHGRTRARHAAVGLGSLDTRERADRAPHQTVRTTRRRAVRAWARAGAAPAGCVATRGW